MIGRRPSTDLCAWLAVVAVMGCSSSSLSPACAPGMTAACACAGGRAGTQLCGASSTFQACSCADAGPAIDARQEHRDADAAEATSTPDEADEHASAVDAAIADGSGVDVADGDRSPDGAAADRRDGVGVDDCGACLDQPRFVTLAGARHLVADRTRGVLYVTLPGNHPDYPNRLVVIDPQTLSVSASAPLGSDPNVMALADDGSRLWVGIDGAYQIRSVDLTGATPAAAPPHVLPRPMFGGVSQTVKSMAALRGKPSSVFVALAQGSYVDGLVILDDGEPRAGALPIYQRASVVAAGEGDTLFGFNDEDTGFAFFSFAATAAGLSATGSFPKLIDGFHNHLVYADHRIYASSGEVIDVSDPTKPVRVGKFPHFGLIELLPGTSKAVLLTGTTFLALPSLYLLDTTTFTEGPSLRIANSSLNQIWDLGLVSADTMAFLCGGDQVSGMPVRLAVVKTSLLNAVTPAGPG